MQTVSFPIACGAVNRVLCRFLLDVLHAAVATDYTTYQLNQDTSECESRSSSGPSQLLGAKMIVWFTQLEEEPEGERIDEGRGEEQR